MEDIPEVVLGIAEETQDKIIWRDRCFCHTGNGKILPSRTYRKEFPASRSSCFRTFWKASV